MFFRPGKPKVTQAYKALHRRDHWQIGVSTDIYNEVSSIRQRCQFETVSRNPHLARDVGLTQCT